MEVNDRVDYVNDGSGIVKCIELRWDGRWGLCRGCREFCRVYSGEGEFESLGIFEMIDMSRVNGRMRLVLV